MNRRRFFALGTGLAGSAAVSSIWPQPGFAQESCSPPIPSGPFNGSSCPFPIPWLDKNGSQNQSPMPGAELSNIFHFKGQIARCNGFVGMGTDNKGNRIPFGSPTTDFSYMKGTYFAGRQEHTGVFAHIWLTLFSGQVAPQNQIHDFHPPIAPSGLYWVAPVPDGGLEISADGRTATLKMSRVPIIDQPRWPALDAAVKPAFLTFRMVWKASDQPANTDDASKMFRFTGHTATVQMEASVEVPSEGFSWKSDPLETSHANFALMGEEVNGRYYSK